MAVDHSQPSQVLMQEELPLDPDEIGDPDPLVKTNWKHQNISRCQPRHSALSDTIVEYMDTDNSVTSVETNLLSTSSDGQSLSGVDVEATKRIYTGNFEKGVSSIEQAGSSATPCVIEAIGNESVEQAWMDEKLPKQPTEDIEWTESGMNIAERSSHTEQDDFQDELDGLMDDLDDEEFCDSFTNFDDDGDDLAVVEAVEQKQEVQDEVIVISDEECENEEVEYVKTIADMAKEANTVDLFDPKILGEFVIV